MQDSILLEAVSGCACNCFPPTGLCSHCPLIFLLLSLPHLSSLLFFTSSSSSSSPPLYHQLHCLPKGPWAKEQHQAYYAARLGSNRSHNHHSLNYTIEGESSENIQCHEVFCRLQCAHVARTTDHNRFLFCQKSASAAQPAIRLVHLGAFRSSVFLSLPAEMPHYLSKSDFLCFGFDCWFRFAWFCACRCVSLQFIGS